MNKFLISIFAFLIANQILGADIKSEIELAPAEIEFSAITVSTVELPEGAGIPGIVNQDIIPTFSLPNSNVVREVPKIQSLTPHKPGLKCQKISARLRDKSLKHIQEGDPSMLALRYVQAKRMHQIQRKKGFIASVILPATILHAQNSRRNVKTYRICDRELLSEFTGLVNDLKIIKYERVNPDGEKVLKLLKSKYPTINTAPLEEYLRKKVNQKQREEEKEDDESDDSLSACDSEMSCGEITHSCNCNLPSVQFPNFSCPSLDCPTCSCSCT